MAMTEDINEFLSRMARWKTPEPFPTTFFDDAVHFQNYDDSISSPLSSGNSQSSRMLAPPSRAPSEGSQVTTDGVSSAATPESPFPSSPPVDVLVENPVRASIEDLHGLRRLDDSFTIPQPEKQELPRPPKLIVGNPRSSRQRKIKDLNKVNDVRDNGACMKCRIQRVSCSTSGYCPTCVRACPKFPEICCNRKDFGAIAREDSPKRFACLTRANDNSIKNTLRLARPDFGNDLFEGQIFLDRDCSRAALPACLRNYTCRPPGRVGIPHAGCTFSRNHFNPALSQENQLEWAQRSISQEDARTFEGAIESFIRSYVRSGHDSAHERPQFAFLEKVHVLKSSYKICRSETLFFDQSNGRGVVELPLPAQAELRGVARYALESSERDILVGLDKYLKSPRISDQDRPAIWAALWQLMLIYRDLLRNVAPSAQNAEALFNSVAIFYATLFRTTAALKSLDNVAAAWSSNDPQRAELVKAFAYAMNLRDTFYQSIVAGVAAIDQRLKTLVVDPEIKVLNRKQSKKPAGAKRGAPRDNEGDELMGGC